MVDNGSTIEKMDLAGSSRSKAPLSLIAALLFIVIGHGEVMKLGHWKSEDVLHWDVAAYYHYLPALFIHNDLLDLTYVREEDPHISVNDERNTFGISHIPATGHHCLKFTYGTALFELPLFLVAHAVASSRNDVLADGYSSPYQLSVVLSAILFVVIGLFFLRSFLLRYVDDLSAAIAMAVIAAGTNLYFYSTFNAGMSHAYLFFLFAVILERTDAWHRKPTASAALAIGLCAGLVTLTRPVDGVVLLIPILWNCWPTESGREKWDMVRVHRGHLLLAALAFVIPLIPQSLYWHATTGQYLYYSYTGEGFEFRPSNIVNGLFSYRKGWFVYSPLVILGFIGIALMLRQRTSARLVFPLLIYFPIAITLIFSWQQWWYGGGLGARPLIGSLPLLALPMAWLSNFLKERSRGAWIVLIVVIFIGIRLNMFQQYQYQQSILHWDQMNRERYWEIFLKHNWDDLRPFPYDDDAGKQSLNG